MFRRSAQIELLQPLLHVGRAALTFPPKARTQCLPLSSAQMRWPPRFYSRLPSFNGRSPKEGMRPR
jgi:hypothetical protein